MQYASPYWTLLLPLLTLSAMLTGEPKNRLWTSLLAVLVYCAMQFLLPKCRVRLDHYYSPVNIALLVMLLKLVIAPAFLMGFGPESSVLSSLPASSSMEAALAIDSIAFVALCLGLSAAPSERRAVKGFTLPTPNLSFVLIFASLGLVGFVAEFGSLGRLIQYFTEPALVTEIKQNLEGTWTGLIGTFLRPFLAFSLVAAWSRLADQSRPLWQVTLSGVFVALIITLANMTFNFNRAAFVFPLLTLAAVYNDRIRRIPIAGTAVVAALALPVLLMMSFYRSDLMAGKQSDSSNILRNAAASVSENVQGYAVGPQYTGLFYERIAWGDSLFGGSTLVASALSPLPVFGKPFRESSGPVIFNQAIYGISGIEDQILPLNAELFANFHLPGVIGGFLALGFLLGKSELWIASSTSLFVAFALQYAAIWAAMLAAWSLSIYSQILIYFFGPVYLYLFATYLREFLRTANTYNTAKSWGSIQ